jgi:hypothetical protein
MEPRYSVTPGDPRAHKAAVLALAARNMTRASELRYAKYYERNPSGPPIFFLARERGTESFVGMASLFPSVLRLGGERFGGAMSADFAVDAGHRAFGPAIALQRALTAAVRERELTCAYGSPNRFSQPIVERVGYVRLGTFTRFLKVLKSEYPMRRRLGNRALARLVSPASSLVDPILWAAAPERRYKPPAGLCAAAPQGFDERFGDLWRSALPRDRVVVERDSERLNWKYEFRSPRERSFAIFAVSSGGGSFAGYVVYRVKGDVWQVFDILSLDSRELVDALVAEFVLAARDAGAAAIELLHLGGDDVLTARLEAFGFLRRQVDTSVQVYVSPDARPPVELRDAGSWRFLPGDNDV